MEQSAIYAAKNLKMEKTNKKQPECRVHKVLKEWQPTTFEYEEDGISVRVPNVHAWVCPADGESSNGTIRHLRGEEFENGKDK